MGKGNSNGPSIKVGDTFKNKQGLNLTVVGYRNTKSVDEEWHNFQNFAEWALTKTTNGYEG